MFNTTIRKFGKISLIFGLLVLTDIIFVVEVEKDGETFAWLLNVVERDPDPCLR